MRKIAVFQLLAMVFRQSRFGSVVVVLVVAIILSTRDLFVGPTLSRVLR
jgi:hypothetical protein